MLSLLTILLFNHPATNPDTIYTQGKQVICTVKEVAPDVVKYTFPNEEALYTLFVNQVQKIHFASGRIQVFAPSRQMPSNPTEWSLVAITQVEGEVKGLVRIGEVSATAKGTTTLSGTEKVRKRALDKLKIQAAMMGGSTVFLTGQNVAGSQIDAAETAVSGVVYAENVPTAAEFTEKVGQNRSFTSTTLRAYSNSQFDANERAWRDTFEVKEILEEPGKTILRASQVKGEDGRFRLIFLGKESFFVQYRRADALYTLEVKY